MAKGINPVEVQKFLRGASYPAAKDELINHARKAGADEGLLSILERLPGERFETPADVSEAIGDMENKETEAGDESELDGEEQEEEGSEETN